MGSGPRKATSRVVEGVKQQGSVEEAFYSCKAVDLLDPFCWEISGWHCWGALTQQCNKTNVAARWAQLHGVQTPPCVNLAAGESGGSARGCRGAGLAQGTPGRLRRFAQPRPVLPGGSYQTGSG